MYLSHQRTYVASDGEGVPLKSTNPLSPPHTPTQQHNTLTLTRRSGHHAPCYHNEHNHRRRYKARDIHTRVESVRSRADHKQHDPSCFSMPLKSTKRRLQPQESYSISRRRTLCGRQSPAAVLRQPSSAGQASPTLNRNGAEPRMLPMAKGRPGEDRLPV